MPNVFGCLSVKSRYLWGLQVFRVDCTKYVYFGGQVIAEKNSAGDWTDYIFANGQRIAKAEGLNRDLHIFGTTSASGQFAVFNFPNAAGLSGYTIRTGDTLHLTQGQPAGSKGGIVLSFTDGSNSNWSVKDQDGYYLNDDETQVPAHLRSIDLSSLAGKTISQVAVNQEGDTATGPWNVYYDYVSLTSTDGTVVPIYTGQTSSPLTVGSHSAGETGLGSKIDTNRGKATSVTDVTTYYVADHLGSSRLILSGNGYPVWSGVFLPYGQEWNPQMTMNTYKFTGDEHDSESNLDHTLFRQYQSTQGRWLSPDPAGLAAADLINPQSFNQYSYVLSTPVNSADASGLCPECRALLDVPDPCSWCTSLTFAGVPVYGGGAWVFLGSGTGPSGTVGGLQYTSQIGVFGWGWGQIGTGIGWNFGQGNGIGEDEGGDGAAPSVGGLLKTIVSGVHKLACAAAGPLIAGAKASGGTVGAGIGGSFGIGAVAGIAGNGSFSVVADSSGNVGIALSGGGNPGWGVIGLGAQWGRQFTVSNASTIFDLNGASNGSSGSVGPVGVSITASGDVKTFTATLGPGVFARLSPANLERDFTLVTKATSINCGDVF